MKTHFYILLLVVVCYSCSSTNSMSLSVKIPAPVTIRPEVRTVAIVDRTEAATESKVIDILHKGASLETKGLQAAGAQSSLQGLYDELTHNGRFNNIKRLDYKLTSFGAGIFPNALAWDSVEKICRQSNTDILISLELFDAQTQIAYSGNPTNIKLGMTSLPVLNHNVNIATNLKSGWRIYDPATKSILDEYVVGRSLNFAGSGINPLEAASALAGRKEAVKDAGNKGGAIYANRVVPYWLRVYRDYFVRGNENFKIAKRKAQSGNWDGAADIWKKESASSDRKAAGRACYNMAIICEINGYLDDAIEWTQKSYEDYNVKIALKYLNILRSRKREEDLLNYQLTSAK
ncbi:DUF6340 family protein [Pinibacter soli]|uniref:DUF6340 family protein n=1 Tax=Pinibacter soli TaxID=3044211 RepID=A0ABT6RJI1_9BACT|nr:DUF6340 family protein [Pinibacter soli]MDI3322581.1 DUF6340 family protein [Pinibacter soli]